MHTPLGSFTKWLQLKIYQLEVNLGVYIFTPVEKFIFYSVLFLLFSLTFIATVLYLPQHVQFIINRAWFYMNGDAQDVAVVAAAAKSSVAIQNLAHSALETAAKTVAAATGHAEL
ncbi:hypothetical protein B0T22DRAFT_482864 [Podospora appendiculata]|uniref:Uncharacterized protein n=1 Tax=Podospora appendiculata TaxID=314037 RepID=A0AAE0X6F0_9PEZI|nr:hypothetical protein B0T22DRAFT_482864 [Podospora appendiculata]